MLNKKICLKCLKRNLNAWADACSRCLKWESCKGFVYMGLKCESKYRSECYLNSVFKHCIKWNNCFILWEYGGHNYTKIEDANCAYYLEHLVSGKGIK